MEKRKVIIVSLVIILVLCIIPIMAFANKTFIMYNPDNGKPIVAYDQEVPEELVGKEVSIQIPATQSQVIDEAEEVIDEEVNVLSKERNIQEYSEQEIKAQYEEHQNLVNNFKQILYKYHGKEKMDKLYSDLNANNDVVISDYEFPEEGKTLLQYVIDVFDTMNPTEEEKDILREYSQNIVNFNEIDDKDLVNKILNL